MIGWYIRVLAELELASNAVANDASLGKWVFVAALGLLLVWLVCMPRKLIGQAERRPAWWRNVRYWAIVICAIQMWVYWQFG